MKFINKLQKNKSITFGIIFLLCFILSFSPFLKIPVAHAETNYCQCLTNSWFKQKVGTKTVSGSDEECQQKCTSLGTTRYMYGSDSWVSLGIWASTVDGKVMESALELGGNIFLEGIVFLLGKILEFLGWILSIAGIIFGWIIDPNNINSILSNPSLYSIWKMIRDLFNIAFILVLLFSAFATIFQIDKYNYKKILLTLVIMALLVNFSFPITRLLIDSSNILMYSVFNAIGGGPEGTNIFSSISGSSQLETILHPNAPTVTSLLASIVFVFILGITLLAISILFVIRTIALAILLIFSSIAFIGNIFPGMNSFSSKWWDNFFKYAFFGPIMALMLYISMEIMRIAGNSGFNNSEAFTLSGLAQKNNIREPGIIAAFSYFSIPIVLLWMGMGIAQSMSIAGAGAVTKKVQGAMKGLAGAGLHWTNRKMAENKYLRYASPMAVKDAWKRRAERADRKALAASSGKVQNVMNKAIDRAASLNPFIGLSRMAKGFQDSKNTGFWNKSKEGLKNAFVSPSDMDTVDYNFIEQQRYVSEEKRRLMDTNENSDYLLYEMKQAIKRGDPGDQATVTAAHMILAKNNDFNEYAGDLGINTDPQEVKTKLIKDLQNSGLNNTDNIAKTLISTGESAFNSGGFSYGGMGTFHSDKDIDTRKEINLRNFKTLKELEQVEKSGAYKNPNAGKAFTAGFYFTTEEEQANVGAGKFSNLEPQARQRTSHPDTFYVIDKNAKVQDIHLGGLRTYEKLNASDVKNVERARDSMERHAQAWDLYQTNSDIKAKIDVLKNADIVKAFLEKAHHLQNNPNTDNKDNKTDAKRNVEILDQYGNPIEK